MNEIKPFSEDISTGSDYLKVQEDDWPKPESTHFNFSTPKSSYQILKENRIPLTEEERKIVMDRKAVWHHGPHSEETPAVWKSKNSAGEIVYITNTHRAWNHSPTLLGCINRYHKFIKGTA